MKINSHAEKRADRATATLAYVSLQKAYRLVEKRGHMKSVRFSLPFQHALKAKKTLISVISLPLLPHFVKSETPVSRRATSNDVALCPFPSSGAVLPLSSQSRAAAGLVSVVDVVPYLCMSLPCRASLPLPVT
ncbi:hypothetical protein PIB30_086486, partial [Stylosanthes scabra]|nr:hypothetical protein [Stylosanthes scabra]